VIISLNHLTRKITIKQKENSMKKEYTKQDLKNAFNAARKQIKAISGPSGNRYLDFDTYFNSKYN